MSTFLIWFEPCGQPFDYAPPFAKASVFTEASTGQASNSPCVDAGSDTAENLGMDIYTTRTDKRWDEGVVDMGYHYQQHIADLNGDSKVDHVDYAILAGQWQETPGVPSADIEPDGGDNIVNWDDLRVTVDNWLWQASWYEE